MFKKSVLIIFLFIMNLSAYHTVSININNEELESSVNVDLAQFVNRLEVNKFIFGFEYLYVETGVEDTENVLETDYMSSFNFLMKSRLSGFNSITFGLGAKLISTEVGNNSISATPLGIYINFALPIYALPISLSTYVYYAPRPLTFSDGDTYFEHRYELSFEVIEKGNLFIGYRDISVTVPNNNKDLIISKLPYVGMRFGF